LLDDLSDEARAMGAVNTVVNDGGRLVGHNTDGSGWLWGFQRALPQAGVGHVVLLGAGGAGSAIAHAVQRLCARRLTIVDSDLPRAQALRDSLTQLYGMGRIDAAADPAQAMTTATGLIHATPTGMDKLPGLPLADSLLHPGLWVSRDRLLPAGHRAAAGGPRAWLRHGRRRHHGGRPGHRRLQFVHRAHARRCAHGSPFARAAGTTHRQHRPHRLRGSHEKIHCHRVGQRHAAAKAGRHLGRAV
jgi:hypothetical protein